MAEVTIVYWRDIPAQVIAGRGRKAVKLPLPELFEQAIDRAAMKSGVVGTDDYLSEWRKAEPEQIPGADRPAAEMVAERLQRTYDGARLRALIDGMGHDTVARDSEGPA